VPFNEKGRFYGSLRGRQLRVDLSSDLKYCPAILEIGTEDFKSFQNAKCILLIVTNKCLFCIFMPV